MLLTGTDGNFFISFARNCTWYVCWSINGLLVTKIGIPSIVATIGTLFFWRGLVNVISQGSGIAIVDEADGTWHHTIFVDNCLIQYSTIYLVCSSDRINAMGISLS